MLRQTGALSTSRARRGLRARLSGNADKTSFNGVVEAIWPLPFTLFILKWPDEQFA